MFGKVKQAIRVGRHVTDLMRLDCVYSCHKEADGTLCYLLYDWDERGQYIKAREGQWLCEGYDGKWTVTDDPPAKDQAAGGGVNPRQQMMRIIECNHAHESCE